MATDRDDDVARRYRAIAREEPPAPLDVAILAASRRAVGARPSGMRRWGPALSIAAVLMLASGLVLRMQAERPGLETSAPPVATDAPVAELQAPAVAPAAKDAPSTKDASALPREPAPAAKIERKVAAPEARRKPAARPVEAPAPEPMARLGTPASPAVAFPASPAAAPPPAAAATASVAPQSNMAADTSRAET